MANRKRHITKALILFLFFGVGARADGLKPQVKSVGPTAIIPIAVPTPAITPPVVPVRPTAAGRPIIYSVKSPKVRDNSQPSAEEQALMNAFGVMLNSVLGGVNGSAGYSKPSGYVRHSEVALSNGVGGSNPVGIYNNASGTLVPVNPSDLSGPRKIIPTFQKWFGACTKRLGLGECRFENMGIMGDAAHRARRSCHNSGQAIDVGKVTCPGGQMLTTDSAQFFNLANCMANDSNDELQVIFYKASGPNMIQKSDHTKHMHIQLKHCAMVYGSKQ